MVRRAPGSLTAGSWPLLPTLSPAGFLTSFMLQLYGTEEDMRARQVEASVVSKCTQRDAQGACTGESLRQGSLPLGAYPLRGRPARRSRATLCSQGAGTVTEWLWVLCRSRRWAHPHPNLGARPLCKSPSRPLSLAGLSSFNAG